MNSNHRPLGPTQKLALFAAGTLALATHMSAIAAVPSRQPGENPTDSQEVAESDPSPAQQLAQRVESSPGGQPPVMFPNPEVTIDGNPSPNGAVGQPVAPPARPTLPRAVAPPVGDIAISSVDAAPELIDLGTAVRVPRLVLREAPIREVLSLLARAADLNLVFTGAQEEEDTDPNLTVSVDLADESVQEAFNAILLVSGLEANRRGRTIYVGSRLPDGARNLLTRTLRLNEVPTSAAASFLATQGAATQQVFTPVEQIVDPETQRIVREVARPSEIVSVTVNPEEQGTTPLLLTGLSVSTDERLNSITLVGEPRKVQIATSLLTQLDARRRQVAINVKIIDINLLNTEDFSASFSFGIGDSFFVSDNGAAAVNFGGVNPPTQAQASQRGAFPRVTGLPLPAGAEGEPFFDFQPDAPFGDTNFRVPQGFPEGLIPGGVFARPNFGPEDNPFQPGVSEVDEDTIEFSLPGLFEVPSEFLALLQAQITSGNAKILTDPTLVVQEGQDASVNLTQEVVGNIISETEVVDELVTQTVTAQIEEAGLILTVGVDRIDDNGFVSFTVTPIVTAIAATQALEVGGDDNIIALLNRRTLSSGTIRIRDGQTLILTGIIQDNDRTTVSKVPILGDLPILGALFRSTNRETQRNEVVVLVTPQILDDSLRTGYGYEYTPSPEARRVLQEQNLPGSGSPQQ